MAHRVQLALYDLSRGMAKAMSMAILGKQIDGESILMHTMITKSSEREQRRESRERVRTLRGGTCEFTLCPSSGKARFFRIFLENSLRNSLHSVCLKSRRPHRAASTRHPQLAWATTLP